MNTMAFPGYISVFEILAKIQRDLGIVSTDSFNQDDYIEWIAEAVEELSSHPQLIKKGASLSFKNKQASFPCDMYQLLQIGEGCVLPSVSGLTHPKNKFVINGTAVNADVADGTKWYIEYMAIPTDENGFPLIVNNVRHREAILLYCTQKLLYRDVLSGKANAQLWQEAKQSWARARERAKAWDLMPNRMDLENIKRIWMRLLPQVDVYAQNRQNLGENARDHVNPGDQIGISNAGDTTIRTNVIQYKQV